MENRNEVTKMLISYYNMQAGTSFRTNNEDNQAFVSAAVDRANGNIDELKAHIREWIADNKEDSTKKRRGIKRCFYEFNGTGEPFPALDDTDEDENDVQVPSNDKVATSFGILEQALMEVIKKQSLPQIEDMLKGECTEMLQNFIKQEYGTIERKVITVIDGKKADLEGVQHEKLDTIIKFVSNKEPVFLTGPAGSGKNYICKQVAEALGLKFYFTNAVTQEYKLTGFTDAMGNYQATQFYEAFTKGGLFMLDEMDASIPEVLVILNAAIANGYFDFPAPIGYKEAHPDFRVVAAGNTIGHGADNEYVGRNQLDAASLDRFAIVKIDYSETIENGMAGDIELADFCREFRKAAYRNKVQIVVSYRAISRLAKMVQLLSLEEALDTCLVKGLEKDDLTIICNDLHDSKYRTALRTLSEKM